MKPHLPAALLACFLQIWLSLAATAACAEDHVDQAQTPSGELRLGVLAYADISSELPLLRSLLTQLKAASGLTLRTALGTYADMRHWMREGSIDLALVNPGVAAEILAETSAWEYLASDLHYDAVPAAAHAVCITTQDSALRDQADIARAARDDTLQLLLVDPASVAGALVPLYALRELPIKPTQIKFLHSHSQALRSLLQNADRHSIACVWAKALADFSEAASLREIAIEQLSSLKIPRSALLIRKGSAARLVVETALDRLANPIFARLQDWETGLSQIAEWKKGIAITEVLHPSPDVALDDLIASLQHYMHAQLKAPRLALVLAGGGAKCSYQVGALRYIEELLAEARERFSNPELDIKLVVGTSGGAINALSVAMGLSGGSGQQHFEAAWRALDQRDIVLLSPLVRWNMIVWIFALECLFLMTCARVCGIEPEERLGVPRIPAMLVGIAQLSLLYFVQSPWTLLGPSPLLHKLWLCFDLVGREVGTLLFLLGAITSISVWLHRVSILTLIPSRRATSLTLLFLAASLPALQAWSMLWHEETLSRGGGITRAIATSFERLLTAELNRRQMPHSLQPKTQNPAQQLQALSRQISEHKLLRRDLVLTASPLHQAELEVPSDLYFYLPAMGTTASAPQQVPDYGKRGVDLRARPQALLEVLMGSSAIYPVFPARVLKDFPLVGRHVELVDGSFAHRSPLEAAVLWGATHILVIEASPTELVPSGSLLLNTAAALNYLYDQAQLTDQRMRGRVTVYTLSPRAPHIGLLDFAENMISAGIEKGYLEARGDIPGQSKGKATWQKQLGSPLFWEWGLVP